MNPDSPGGGEDAEYVELFYTGRTRFDLQGYWLVFYNGKNSRTYRALDLSGHQTDELGYFLVGSSGMSPAPMVRLPPNTIQNGADAVALYYSNTTRYAVNMAVTAEGLVDAVVYTSRMPEKAGQLVKVLVPGQSILYENDSHSTEDESLSRCHSLSANLQSSFQVGSWQGSILHPQSLGGQGSILGNKTALEAEEVCWQEGAAFAVGEDHKEVMPWTGDTSGEVLPTAGRENCSQSRGWEQRQ